VRYWYESSKYLNSKQKPTFYILHFGVLVLHGVSAVPFEHAVAGGPAVTGFPAVGSVLAVASVLADPGIPILAGGFTYWIVE
jgi:hypothetical protein